MILKVEKFYSYMTKLDVQPNLNKILNEMTSYLTILVIDKIIHILDHINQDHL